MITINRTPFVCRELPALLLAVVIAASVAWEPNSVSRAISDDLGMKGKDQFYGLGRVNAYRAVQ